MERQLKIGTYRLFTPANFFEPTCLQLLPSCLVKPDATAEEVAEAVDGGGEQIFSQAVSPLVLLPLRPVREHVAYSFHSS